jgi:hypothetical protein
VTDEDAMKPAAKARPTELDNRPFPESLCHRCGNSRTVATKTSQFLLCTVLAVKYPRQPVSDCAEFNLGDRRP